MKTRPETVQQVCETFPDLLPFILEFSIDTDWPFDDLLSMPFSRPEPSFMWLYNHSGKTLEARTHKGLLNTGLGNSLTNFFNPWAIELGIMEAK